jgi:hypothetical protein
MDFERGTERLCERAEKHGADHMRKEARWGGLMVLILMASPARAAAG